MRIYGIDKEYTKSEAMSAKAYVAVDSEYEGTGKMEVSELSETVILEYGDNSTYDAVLAMLNAGKRVLVNVDPFYNNNNALNGGVQQYPISPYKVPLQANVPSGNPYIDFTGYMNGQVYQVAHVQLWNSSMPSMPSKINNWCVNDVNPTELAKKSELTALTSRVNALEENGGGAENEMLVTFIESTPNTYPTDITQSLDKTFAEIKAAYDSGLSVYATAKITYSAGTENETTQKDNTRIPLVSADESMIVFEQTIARSNPTTYNRNYSVQFIHYTLLSDNTWTRTYEGKNLTDEILILNFDSDKNLGKTLNNNSNKQLKILRLNTNSEGSHFMDLNLIDSSDNLFGGVGLVEGVLSYVQVRIGYNGITDETITEKNITPLQTVSEG